MPFKEQELVLAQQVAGLAIWEWNVENDELRWLPGSVPILGQPLENIRTQSQALDCIHPDDCDRVKRVVVQSVSGSDDSDTEYRVEWPNGETHWIRARWKTLQHPQRGKFVIGVSQDITDVKRREQGLEKQAKRLLAQARLLDLAYEPILVRDSNDSITFWNKGAERLYGYTQSEALGQTSHTLLCTKFPEPLSTIQSRLNTRGNWEGELVHCTKDGRLLHVASRWQQFSTNGMSVLEKNFDLSQQKALEIAKRWEDKARLLGELSHEVNNPLSAATNAIYMLRDSCDQPVQQYVKIVEESINRIAGFIRKSNELHRVEHHEKPRRQGDSDKSLQ